MGSKKFAAFAVILALLMTLPGAPAFAKHQSGDSSDVSIERCGSGSGNRKAGGTIVGAILGAGAGALIGGKKGAILGAGLGGLAGRHIGANWDKQECEKAQKAMALALDTGTTQVWTSDDGKRAFTAVVDRKYSQQANGKVPLLDGRAIDTSGLQPGSGVYELTKAVNIRSKPTTSGSTVFENLKPGKKLVVMGRTTDGGWALVSSTGVAAEGWVAANYLTATQDDQAQFMVANSDQRPVKVATFVYQQPCVDSHQQISDTDAGNKPVVSGVSTVCKENGTWTKQSAHA